MDIVHRIATLREPKCIWQNPEQSIGRELCSIKSGEYTCWEACGRARIVWDEVRQDLFKHLNDDIARPILAPVGIIIELYMIGKSKQTARPTIWIACADKATRKNIRKNIEKLMRRDGFLERNPGFKVADAPRCPDRQEIVKTGGSDKSLSHFIGQQLYVEAGDGKRRLATGGPVVWIQGNPYQLTVAHFLKDDLDLVVIPGAIHDRLSLDECSFDGDSDDSVERDPDGSKDETLSDGSRTPEDLLSIDSDEESSEKAQGSSESNSVKKELPPIVPSTSHSVEEGDKLASNPAPPAPATITPRNSPTKIYVSWQTTPLAGPFLSSEDGAHPSLDYALIPITEQRSWEERNWGGWGNRGLRLPTPEDWETNPSVAAWTPHGAVQGELSATAAYMRTPGGKEFQEVFSIFLHSDLDHGDCGAAVVDLLSGVFYGHIIAGTPGMRRGYITPSTQIFDDIRARLGCEVSLTPTATPIPLPCSPAGPEEPPADDSIHPVRKRGDGFEDSQEAWQSRPSTESPRQSLVHGASETKGQPNYIISPQKIDRRLDLHDEPGHHGTPHLGTGTEAGTNPQTVTRITDTTEQTFIAERGLAAQSPRRVRLACYPCRARKAMCDGRKPVCTTCSLRGWQDSCRWLDKELPKPSTL